MQHYFIGVKLPEGLAKQLVDFRNEWQLELSHKRLPVAEDLHITLVYLGAVEAEVLTKLISELNELAEVIPHFTLTLSGVETFGNPSTPRVIYTSIEEQPMLYKLQNTILEKCLALLLPVDRKPFVPHITLAKKWNEKLDVFSKEMHIDKISFNIRDFSIYSINPKEVPSYQPVHTIFLKDLTT
ncbi:MAG TPA: RNA 2',3'-cyclic phosphodiesterase [Paenisporosarcina sp.]|nr:RNA 2',3'-cyclic phosphodiesterase [Paenisporosarcina sp.]